MKKFLFFIVFVFDLFILLRLLKVKYLTYRTYGSIAPALLPILLYIAICFYYNVFH